MVSCLLAAPVIFLSDRIDLASVIRPACFILVDDIFSPLVGCRPNTPKESGCKSTTKPPLAYPFAFMFLRFCAPSFLTLDFLITNSPGVSSAGTVSLLPLPGTIPPEANLGTAAPIAPFAPAMKPPNPENNLTLPIANIIGSMFFKVSATFMRAVAKDIAVCARILNPGLDVNPLTSANHSSLSFCTCTKRDPWAVCASLVKDVVPSSAVLYASCATPNCISNGITLPICLKPPSCSAILTNCKSPASRPDNASLSRLIAS